MAEISRHELEDYRAAIRFARGVPWVDPERIALWGSSLNGGHVTAITAADARIAAVVSQVPWVGVDFSRWGGRASPSVRGAALPARPFRRLCR